MTYSWRQKFRLTRLPARSSFFLPMHQRPASPTSSTHALIVDPTVPRSRHDMARYDDLDYYYSDAAHASKQAVNSLDSTNVSEKKRETLIQHYRRKARSTMLFLLPTRHARFAMDTEQQQNLKKDEATSLANASPRPPHDNFDNGAHRLPTSNTPQPSSLHNAYRTQTPFSQAPWPQPYDDRRRARLCSFPLFSYMVAMVMAIMLIYEFVQFKSEFGAVLNLSPFNMMLGPNAQTLIRTGAFFPPCMRISENLSPTQMYPCANASNPTHLSSPSWVYALPATQGGACPLQNVCGLTPFRDAAAPDQAYRVITALVNSAGIVQFIINITFLLSFGATTEKQIGTIRYIYVFLVSGTFGYCFASVFVRDVALMGCLGAIYGVAASYLMDCFRSWERSPYPAPSICKFLLIVVLGAIAGYLPGASNFCHMGGLLGGLLADWSVSASQVRLRDARLMWSLMMVFRLFALAALIVLFYITLSNFYSNHSWAENCLWCHYVSCLPFFDACSSL